MKTTLFTLVAVFCLSGCGSKESPTAPSTSSPAPSRGIFADVTDPTGDAQARPLAGVTIPPDLVGATLEAKDGALTVTISFAAGTMSQPNTRWVIYVDLDQNPATGAHNGAAVCTGCDPLIGYEYIISFRSSPGGTPVAGFPLEQVTSVLRLRFDANQRTWFSDTIGTAELTFPTANQSRTVIPLTLLGNDDGRLAFRIVAQQWGISTSGNLNLQPSLDSLPNEGLPPAATQ
jgi:hypothetical protein